MIGMGFMTSQADMLVERYNSLRHQPWREQAGVVLTASMERWESTLQGVADSQMKTWSHVARPQGKSVSVSVSQGKSVSVSHGKLVSDSVPQGKASVAGTAVSVANAEVENANRDAMQSKFWLLLSAMLYTVPVNACVVFLFFFRSELMRIFQYWAIAELTFAVYRYFEYQRVNTELIHNPIPEREEVRVLLERILSLRDDVNAREFLSGWFLGCPSEKIKRGNMIEFLSYAFYHRSFGELSPSHRAEIEGHIKRAEEAWGLSFPEGYVEGLEFMAHNREPLRAVHHPLALYVWGHCVALLTGIVMRCLGFEKRQSREPMLHYWYRPPLVKETKSGNDKKKQVPRIFVHGLGIGLTPYLGFIHMLLEGHNEAMVVVEMGHIALRIHRKIPSADEVVEAILGIHKEHSLGPAQYIGHSYGSLIIAGLTRRFPEVVSSLGLADPVCFLLCLPDVVFNFVYRIPGGENFFMAFCDWARWFFCSREIQVAQVLCRGFDWHKLHLWIDQMPSRAVVMLAGKDKIVPAKEVKRYLEKHDVNVLYYPEYQHAEYLFRPSAQRAFLEALSKSRFASS